MTKDRSPVRGRLAALFADMLRRMAAEGMGVADAGADAPFLPDMIALALRQAPGDKILHGLMAEALFNDGAYEDVPPHARAAGWRGEQGLSNRYMLGVSLYRLERYEDALPHLRALARRYPGDHELTMMAAYTEFRRDDFAAAGRLLARLDMAELDRDDYAREITAMMRAGMQALAAPRSGRSPAP